jgi:serine/threonine protein kinase
MNVWTLGCLLHVLLTGQEPFANSSEILTKEPQGLNDRRVRLSRDAVHLLERCLCKNQIRRISLDEIAQHPWVCQEKVTKSNF